MVFDRRQLRQAGRVHYKERHMVFKDYSRPWFQHAEILRIKRKYEIEKHKDDKAFLLAHPEAVKELRVSRSLLFEHARRVGSAPTATNAGRPVGALARRPGVLSDDEA